MDFSTRRKKPATESVLPMINVVFLLLIFFLMTTRIAPHAPFAVTPPVTALETSSEAAPILFLSAEGNVFFEGHAGDAALHAVGLRAQKDAPVTLRADAVVEAATVAALLAKLRGLGFRKINLVGQNG